MTQLTKDTFEKFIEESEKPVIIDFWAEWCGPCKMMAPVLEKLSEKRTDIEIAKVNVDDEGELAIKFGIMSIPAFVCFKNGKEASRTVGYMSEAELLAVLGL